jgi:hypothetical protein
MGSVLPITLLVDAVAISQTSPCYPLVAYLSDHTKDEAFRAASCDGKVAFVSAAQAKRAAKRRTGRVIYRCKFCPHWHTGTPDPKPKKFEKRKKLVKLFLQTEWTE